MIFFLALVPLAFAYLVVSRLLRERDRYLQILVAYGLGLALFLCGVNIGFHFTSLRQSVYLTLTAMIVGGLALLRRRPGRASGPSLGTLEAVFLVVFASTVFFWTLFWHMKFSDDDFFPHAPLMGLYLRDIFPPRNPLYPDALLLGHYGRDLTIAALSVLFGDRFFPVQYTVTSLNQVVIALLAYFMTRRYVRSAGAAAFAVVLAFLGINSAFRFGLLETAGNNNSFAYLYLFLNTYLYLVALWRRDLSSTLVCIIAVATYGIVYETHFGVLLIVFALFPVVLVLRRRRWRLAYARVATVIVAAAIAISLVQGGSLTDIGRRHLWGRGPTPGLATPADVQLTNQEVRMRFPKRHFKITSYDGSEYSPFSRKLLTEAGYSIALLPVLAVLMVVIGCWWGIFLASVAVVAVLVPAVVDFGSFSGESFRFLFFSGVGTTMLLGTAMGLGLRSLRRWWRPTWWVAVVMVTAGVVILSSAGIRRLTADLLLVWRYPEMYYWHGEEWACHGVSRVFCDPLDARAAVTLRSLTKKGDTILTNVSSESVSTKRKILRDVMAHSIVSALSQAFVTGHGVRVSKDRIFAMTREYRESQGFRAIAYWNTGDTALLRTMSVTHLLIDPARLPAGTYETIRQDRRLELLDREEDPRRGAVREVYRLHGVDPPPPTAFEPLSLAAIAPPLTPAPASFHRVPFVVTSAQQRHAGALTVGYRVFYGALQMNASDEIQHVATLTSIGPRQWSGELYFVAPYESGTYDVVMYTLQANSWVALPSVDSRATFRVTVPDRQNPAVRNETLPPPGPGSQRSGRSADIDVPRTRSK